MQTRGAIIRQAPGKIEVVDLEVDDPRDNEVQVKLVGSGLCHSDDHIVTGDIPVGIYPFALGHEGAGVVTKAGANTKGLKEGDHVVFSFLPSCGHCRWCASGQQNLCDLGAGLLSGARWNDLTSYRLRLAGSDTPVGQMLGISTFCETTTVAVDSVVKVPEDVPLDVVCLLGCGVGTGWGAAVNSGGVQPGHTTIVMGVGGIGINAVQGAANAGATAIIAVDPVALKREKAQELGATHGAATMEEATELAKELTNGQGADQAIVTTGVIQADHVGQAMASIRKAGTVVVTALGNIADTTPLPVSLSDITLFQKRIQGSLFGASNPNWDILRQIELYRSGALKLDELITTTYSLDEVAAGYQDMHDGKNIRGVVRY
ncbi:NDMA-dependent alcohol dehydrogenase [Pseudonocardia sp. WMMC193]|uniref:NDMA-dependent alcohol dehydrogenase n=1 Tax=Pseudonocardia sp. WMMC193 TaxID=2911965 RepID=UPI001F0051CC|nr:NDMA-dependent alcohol dehydrogenase [Pseudonocardia sp. WMMC193]MCF7550878.1 NDMA-dependent alcohol dehydrogenase [Pseudonocardia sp. WMMC193]